jgi:antitoxin component of MazEF toxin-antitoxin module
MLKLRVRRIGNSLGVLLPKDEVVRQGLREGDEVVVEVRKSRALLDVWGALRGRLGDVDTLNREIDEGEDLG